MKVINQYFYPLICFLYNTAISIPSRIAIDVFTLYHSIKQDDKAREIDNISKAIQALENNENAKLFLCRLRGELRYNYEEVTKQDLLAALKTHRFGLFHLYKGVAQNSELSRLIYNYSVLPDSPLRPSSTTILPTVIIPMRSLGPPLEQLPQEKRGQLLILLHSFQQNDKIPLQFDFPPLVFFHTVRCQPALQDLIQQIKSDQNKYGDFLKQLTKYISESKDLTEHLDGFSNTHQIQRKILFQHIQEKHWEEFVNTCLP